MLWLNDVHDDANAIPDTAVYVVEIWDRQGSRNGATVQSDYMMMSMNFL